MVTTRQDFNTGIIFLRTDADISSNARETVNALFALLPVSTDHVMNAKRVYQAQTKLECTVSPRLKSLREAITGNNALVVYNDVLGCQAQGDIVEKLVTALHDFADGEGQNLVTRAAKDRLIEIRRAREVYHASKGHHGGLHMMGGCAPR